MTLALMMLTSVGMWAADETRTYTFSSNSDFTKAYLLYNNNQYLLSGNNFWYDSNVVDCAGVSFQLNAFGGLHLCIENVYDYPEPYACCRYVGYRFRLSHATKWVKHVKIFGTNKVFEEDVYNSHSYDSYEQLTYNGIGRAYKVELTLSDEEPFYVPNDISYIDADGVEQVVTSKRMTDEKDLTAGWWVVESDITIPQRINISGTVNLILCDGAKLTADKGITIAEDCRLNIYGQTLGTGTLEANGQKCDYGSHSRYFSGIGGYEYYQNGAGWIKKRGGTTAIYGGTVTATGNTRADGIGGGGESAGGTTILSRGTITASRYGGTVQMLHSFMLQNTDTEATLDNIDGHTIVPQCVVTFLPNGASGMVTRVAKGLGTNYELPESMFTPPYGKRFGGWDINAAIYAAGANYTVSEDVTANATWQQMTHDVTFNLNGHGTTAVDAQTINYGDYATEPAAPSELGYTFGGWYREQACVNRWVFNGERVKDDHELFAKWTQDAYTITYNLDGGVNVGSNPLSYTVHDAVILSAPTKEGYTFLGWTGSNGETPEQSVSFSAATGDKSYTAHWQINQYTITFDTDGASLSAIDPITADYGTPVTAPAAVARQARLFLRWMVADDESDMPTSMPARDITVKPEWANLTHYEYQAPTCNDKGSKDHYYGNNSHYYFENSDHLTYTLTDKGEVEIPALGHNFENPVWTWEVESYSDALTAVVEVTCSRCQRPDYTIVREFVTTVTTEPTETTDGELTYTATANVYGTVYNDSHTEVIPRLGMVAKIGDTAYPYLYSALYAAGNDDEVVLYKDVNEDWATKETHVGTGKYEVTKNVTINLNGHYVKLEQIPLSNSVTIKNGTLRTYLNNANVGASNTLTLDNATLEAVEQYHPDGDFWSDNIQWLADHIAVTNGSSLHTTGCSSLGSGNNRFTLTIDNTSSVVLSGASFFSYNINRVASQLAQYLPQGYTIHVDGENGSIMYGGSVYEGTVTLSPQGTLETISLAANLANGNYWTTYYNGAIGYTIDAGENACAYTATVSNTTITLHKLGKVIPAGTAVILVGDDSSIDMTASSDAAEYTVSNDLHGVDVATSTSALGTGTFYVLANKNAKFGFHEYTGASMPARKAYLLLAGSEARELTMVFEDEATGILSVHGSWFTVQGSDAWYTLDGRKLSGKPTSKGLYIVNGRKEVVK